MSLAAAANTAATANAGSVPPSSHGHGGGRVINNEEDEDGGERQQIDQGLFSKTPSKFRFPTLFTIGWFREGFRFVASLWPLIPELPALLDNFSLESTEKRP